MLGTSSRGSFKNLLGGRWNNNSSISKKEEELYTLCDRIPSPKSLFFLHIGRRRGLCQSLSLQTQTGPS